MDIGVRSPAMFRALRKILGAVALLAACGAPAAGVHGSEPAVAPLSDATVAPVIVTVHGHAAPEASEEDRGAKEAARPPEPLRLRPEPPAAPDRPSEETVWKVPVFRDDPVRGPADALVTIVAFSEFQCPYCKRAKPTLEAVLKAHPKDVRIVWKDNVLAFHQRAKPAAILARHAFEMGGNPGFWKVHDALFESQPALEDADLRRIAEANKLAWAPIERALASERAPKIEQSTDLAVGLAVRGAPQFFINGKRLLGAQPLEKFEELIAEALVSARALVARGVPRAKIYETILRDATPGESETAN